MEKHQERFEILDGIRGFASLYIVFHHARLVCWESYNTGYLIHPHLYNYFDLVCLYFFSIFKYGAEAVTLFFVLSGLVIHYKQAHGINNKSNFYEFNFFRYLKNRVRRIYPPLIFSIILMVLLAFLSFLLFNKNYPDNLSLVTILGNLSFISLPYFSVVGNNFPLWSLRVEWWIYLVYPLLLFINAKKVYLSYLLVFSFGLVIFYCNFNRSYFWIETFLYLPTWSIGVYLADLFSGRVKYYRFINLLFVFIPISVIIQGKLNNYFSDFIFGLGLIPVFYFILENKQSTLKNALKNIIIPYKALSKFSYTLYIIHFPIQTFIISIYLTYHQNKLPHSFDLAIFSVFVSIIVAYLAHFITEAKIRKINN